VSNDILTRFGKRFAEVDAFAHLVYCRGNYYAKQAAHLSDRELQDKLKKASETIDLLCMEHAVMEDLLINCSPADRTIEESNDRVMKLLMRVTEMRKDRKRQTEHAKATHASIALAEQELLSGKS
jgi:hypothetical protein